jgi:hypothetical protein
MFGEVSSEDKTAYNQAQWVCAWIWVKTEIVPLQTAGICSTQIYMFFRADTSSSLSSSLNYKCPGKSVIEHYLSNHHLAHSMYNSIKEFTIWGEQIHGFPSLPQIYFIYNLISWLKRKKAKKKIFPLDWDCHFYEGRNSEVPKISLFHWNIYSFSIV